MSNHIYLKIEDIRQKEGGRRFQQEDKTCIFYVHIGTEDSIIAPTRLTNIRKIIFTAIVRDIICEIISTIQMRRVKNCEAEWGGVKGRRNKQEENGMCTVNNSMPMLLKRANDSLPERQTAAHV